MGDFRTILGNRRWIAAMVVAWALWIRVIVPAGFMPVFADGAFHVELCSGHGVEAMAAMPGMAHGHTGRDEPGKADQPCGFTGHAPASMAGADPILLVLAVAFVLATVYRIPGARPVPRLGFLRPHPTGPPAIA